MADLTAKLQSVDALAAPAAHAPRSPRRADFEAAACTQAPDAKKEEFRQYLGKAGVIDALTKGARPWRASSARRSPRPSPAPTATPPFLCAPPAVLVGLYEEPEKPQNAIEYARRSGASHSHRPPLSQPRRMRVRRPPEARGVHLSCADAIHVALSAC